jgi:hypothetical protein
MIKQLLATAALVLVVTTAAQARNLRPTDDMTTEEIQALPINRLLNAYRFFIYVTICNQSREGYFVTPVNDADLMRAHNAAKAIQEKALKDDPSIDSDHVWQLARKDPVDRYVIEHKCRSALVQLINDSPKSAWTVEKP